METSCRRWAISYFVLHVLTNGCPGIGSQRAAAAVQIKMGQHYLQNVIKLKFPQLRSQQAALVAEAAAREVNCSHQGRRFVMAKNVHHGPVRWSCLIKELPAGAIQATECRKVRSHQGDIRRHPLRDWGNPRRDGAFILSTFARRRCHPDFSS